MHKLNQLSELIGESERGGVVQDSYRPRPSDFDEFLSWACYQLEVKEEVIVFRHMQNQYVSILDQPRGKSKLGIKNLKQSDGHGGSPDKLEGASAMLNEVVPEVRNMVKIIAVYSGDFDHLTQITFEKNHPVPRMVLKVIGLIIKFHIHVDTIIMKRGIDKYTVHELSKLLLLSNITDVCLDGAFVKEGNYSILLDKPANMRYLSLARCSINDRVVAEIASKLVYPMPASNVLALLNLSTNCITDKGAKYLATALRSNRCLNYLNLAGNMLTDAGAKAILNSLQEFSLTDDEIMSYRNSYLTYLKNLENAKANLQEGVKDDLHKKQPKKKTSKTVGKKGFKDIENEPPNFSYTDLKSALQEKANSMARKLVGEFRHPFNRDHVSQRRDGECYSLGKNVLCYLNMAYNDLTIMMLRKLVRVIENQKLAGRKPRGLVTVCIEGNPMPNVCNELHRIEQLLESGMGKRKESSPRRRGHSVYKKV